jgi:diacylglycerol kinase family enzyme
VPPRTLVIVNPRSRAGATGSRWDAIEVKLRDALGPLDVARTAGPRDAERLAREGVRAGATRIVVAGGDGTTSEVATGLLAANLGADAEIGLLPLGTGGDFVKTLGIPRDPEAAIRCLVEGKPRRVDAGCIHYRQSDGTEARSYFVNISSVGISGLVVKMVNESNNPLGGYRAAPVCVRVDGQVVHDGPMLVGVVASGRYFGGGMKIAPGARPDDGLFDVLVVESLPLRRLLSRFHLLYRGRHVEVEGIHHCRGRRVEMEASERQVEIEVDGEPLGETPIRVEMLPAALTVLVPAA